jgi:hypothetical protein
MTHGVEFVTITGIDEWTDLDRIQALSARFPVEWAILMSPDLQGLHPRFPAHETIDAFRSLPVRKAAHLCGAHAKAIMASGEPAVDLAGFDRAQINHRRPVAELIAGFAFRHGVQGIMQSRTVEFPEAAGVQMLYDRSGGHGRLPPEWPVHPGMLVGIAGGISPATIGTVLATIPAGPVWLDMETGVRTDEDRLDLDLAEAVLVATFG